jgi:hypothetical protein
MGYWRNLYSIPGKYRDRSILRSIQTCSGLHPAFCPLDKKGKAIPVTGRGGPKGCETPSLPHFLDSLFIDGGEVVSLTRRPALVLISVRG